MRKLLCLCLVLVFACDARLDAQATRRPGIMPTPQSLLPTLDMPGPADAGGYLYSEARAKSLKTGVPFVVFVGTKAVDVPGAHSVSLTPAAWEWVSGEKSAGLVVVNHPHAGESYCDHLPAPATAGQITVALRRLSSLCSAAKLGGCGCVNCPLGGACMPGNSCGSPACPFTVPAIPAVPVFQPIFPAFVPAAGSFRGAIAGGACAT